MFVKNAAEMKTLGRNLAREFLPNSIILLKGPIGSGKTSLVKGIADGLSVIENITSPTFGLSHHYDSGRLPIIHMDLYRINNKISAREFFWEEEEEAHQTGAILIVEWPELILPFIETYWLIEIEYAKNYGRHCKFHKPLVSK